MELDKKTKANAMALAIQRGYFEYFDKIEYIPKQHKYRYYSANEERIHYLSLTALADIFDKEVQEEDKQQLIDDYFAFVEWRKNEQ